MLADLANKKNLVAFLSCDQCKKKFFCYLSEACVEKTALKEKPHRRGMQVYLRAVLTFTGNKRLAMAVWQVWQIIKKLLVLHHL